MDLHLSLLLVINCCYFKKKDPQKQWAVWVINCVCTFTGSTIAEQERKSHEESEETRNKSQCFKEGQHPTHG